MKDFLFLDSELVRVYDIADVNESKMSCAYQSALGSLYISPSNNDKFFSKKGLSVYLEGFCQFKDSTKKYSSQEANFLEAVLDAYLGCNSDFEFLINKITGIFTVVIIDDNEKSIYVANDYFNQQKVYFKQDEQHIFITNNLSIYSRLYGNKKDISRDALCLLMRYNCIPAPYTIYHNVSKLSVGQFVEITVSKSPKVGQYKSINQLISSPDNNIGISGATDKTEQALNHAIDFILFEQPDNKPVSAFLSGGIDSSLVSALLATKINDLCTYSLGFKDNIYDESKVASQMAKQIKTNHKVVYFEDIDVLKAVQTLPKIYHEPFADSSQLPTHLMCQAVPDGTLVFSGDGGDEVFGGYNRYISAKRIWEKSKLLPLTARRLLSKAIFSRSPTQWNNMIEKMYPFLPKKLHITQSGDKFYKLANILPQESGKEFYKVLTSHIKNPERIVLGGIEPKTKLDDSMDASITESFESWMMAMDLQTYLPDDGVVKVSAAANYNNIQVISPFLNESVIKMASSLPMKYKINGSTGKWVLREILKKYYSTELLNQPKKGFGIPLDKLLRVDLRDWANNLLDQQRIKEDGFFDSEFVHNKWQQHLSGHENNQYLLWNILMFQAWMEEYL